MNNLDPEERHEVHNARVIEVTAGDISGKEFVASLVQQVGLTFNEAMHEWENIKSHSAIAGKTVGERVMYPYEDGFRVGVICRFFGSHMGVVVLTDVNDTWSMRVPFSLIELKVVKS